MPIVERKMLENLHKKGVELPRGIPKDWRAYNDLKDRDERGRVKRVIRELHGQHCPPGCFQNTDGQSVSYPPARSGYRSPSTSSSRSSGYGGW